MRCLAPDTERYIITRLLLAGLFALCFSVKAAEKTAESEEDSTPFDTPELVVADADPLVLGFVDARSKQNLNGTWNFLVDPMGVGAPGGFFGGWASTRTPVDEWQLLEYSYPTARQIRVPGDFNTQFEDVFFYRDRVWYQRVVDVVRKADTRYHLWLGGANFDATIFLNGNPIVRHRGGYVPFSIDVTDQLIEGANDLVVWVNNRLGADTVPTERTDWWPYGGLARDVMLVETPSAYIVNAKFELNEDGKGLQGSVQTRGFNAGDRVNISIPELSVKTSAQVNEDGLATWRAKTKPTLWHPDNPKLYEVSVTAGQDRIQDSVGFKTIETQGHQVLLNGQPIRFTGISTHEEPIGRDGVAYSEQDMRAIFAEAKALGANFVRLAHYPYSRHAAKVADEVGLLLWEEVPIYWNIAWENEETLAIARDQVARLVQRDWNRASVAVWSVANETPYSQARMTFLGQLIDDVRGMDDTRLVSAALLGAMNRELQGVILHLAAEGLVSDIPSEPEKAIFKAILDKAGDQAPEAGSGFAIVIEDPLGELVDMVSYNEYFGWYYSRGIAPQLGVSEKTVRQLILKFMPQMEMRSAFDKPMFISEFGAGAKSGKRGEGVWTEDYQAAVYRAQVAMLANSPQVQGMTPWILKDFRAMLRTLPGIQDYRNRKGIIDENGRHKLAYDVLKDFYNSDWAKP